MAYKTLSTLRQAAAGCQACELYKLGTQTVFGSGAPRAAAMLVGEQPGNEEDLQGIPFVGPAGRLLDQALREAGLDREQCYLTNVVKHFKWNPKGKRRIHVTPNATEVRACFPWLKQEIELVQPQVIVCLGAVAAQALFGPSFRVTRQRGQVLSSAFVPGIRILATVHPSAILRAPDAEVRELQLRLFVEDLKKVPLLLRNQETDATAGS
jgi:DNA polymerase